MKERINSGKVGNRENLQSAEEMGARIGGIVGPRGRGPYFFHRPRRTKKLTGRFRLLSRQKRRPGLFSRVLPSMGEVDTVWNKIGASGSIGRTRTR